ncbi:MAG: phospho-N-acetylmuramoyl-pentapeptide-transferase [Oscillospiraceae bacterium]
MVNGTSLVITAVVSFGVTAILGFWLIPFLKKLKYGQTILDIGPRWHKSKENTPTMGGFMFIIGIVSAAILGFISNSAGKNISSEYEIIHTGRFIVGIMMALASGFIGFVDDYVKVVKKRNLGLTVKQKLIMQFIVAVFYLWTMYIIGDNSTVLQIPFMGQLDIGILYYPLCVLGIIFITNSVNLTDGLDGLCSSVTFAASLGFMVISMIMGYGNINILAVATAGGCLGFLVWNFYPAKVFMGDTGSLFLGGLVVAMAFGVNMPLILIFSGIIYIIESLSVVLQVASFKLTGKRIFKMSPIHHHYEMCGYSEMKIVTIFTVITFIGSAIAIWATVLMR